MDAINRSVQRNNEVVGLKANASAANQTVLGRTFRAVEGGVKNFFGVNEGNVWALAPMREIQARELKALHAAA